MIDKTYIGDSVYAELENGMLKLTTENYGPEEPDNTIYLEPEVFYSMMKVLISRGWINSEALKRMVEK